MARAAPHSWRHPAVLALAGMAAMSGFGQFGATAALADIAAGFGEPVPDAADVAGRIGLTGTALGIGVAVIRLAALASLPLASLADRWGRRRTSVGACAAGLAITVAAAASPGYWWFVALFALARPLLTATTAVAGVAAAEETTSHHRARALALVGAAYAVGTGILALLRGGAGDALGFREVFALSAVPLALLALLRRAVREPDRFRGRAVAAAGGAAAGQAPAVHHVPGRVPRAWLPRLSVILAVHLAVGLVSGPVHTYLFVYGEGVLGLSPAQMAGVFIASGAAGLAGLLAGRWAADRLGRRITAGVALAASGLAGLATYAGAAPALVLAYPVAVFAASVYTPAAGALDAELFPTSVRATAAGWISAAQISGAVVGLAAFGVLADVFGAFPPAALAVGLPAVALAAFYGLLPETRGLELEQSAPESGPGSGPASGPASGPGSGPRTTERADEVDGSPPGGAAAPGCEAPER